MSTLGSCAPRKPLIRGGPAEKSRAKSRSIVTKVANDFELIKKALAFVEKNVMIMPCWCSDLVALVEIRQDPEIVSLGLLDFATKSVAEELKEHLQVVNKASKSKDESLCQAAEKFWSDSYWTSKDVLSPELRSKSVSTNEPIQVLFFISSADDQRMKDFDIIYDRCKELLRNVEPKDVKQ